MFTPQASPSFESPALVSDRIHQGQRPNPSSLGQLVGYKVQAPHFIRSTRGEPRSTGHPGFSPPRSLLSPHKTFPSGEPGNQLRAHRPTLTIEPPLDLAGAIATLHPGPRANPLPERRLRILAAAIARRRFRTPGCTAGPQLAGLVMAPAATPPRGACARAGELF